MYEPFGVYIKKMDENLNVNCCKWHPRNEAHLLIISKKKPAALCLSYNVIRSPSFLYKQPTVIYINKAHTASAVLLIITTMDNTSISFATTRSSFDALYNSTATDQGLDASTTIELPFGIETFAPILMLELITVVTCNLVLMALVIKARKVNNNTNIYLFSLSFSSLLQSINLLCLMITVVARQWIFGREFCYINDFIFRLSFFPILPFHALVSRERYKVIKDPLKYSKASTKKAYIWNIIVWTVSSVLSLTSLIWYAVRTPLSNTQQLLGIECFFALHLIEAQHTISLVEILVISLLNGLWLISFSVFTMWHYVMVLRELHRLTKLRSQARILSDSNILKINQHDKPLHCTAEERAAKSLARMFLFEFVCSFASLIILSVLSLMSLISNEDSSEAAIVLLLSIYMLPGINPLILSISNKRFRKRIKGLLKCELTPEFEETNDRYHHLDETDTVHLPSTGASGAHNTRRRRSLFIINKTNNEGNQARAELSNATVEADHDASEDVTTIRKVVSQRNASIATIGAVDVKIKECAASHDEETANSRNGSR